MNKDHRYCATYSPWPFKFYVTTFIKAAPAPTPVVRTQLLAFSNDSDVVIWTGGTVSFSLVTDSADVYVLADDICNCILLFFYLIQVAQSSPLSQQSPLPGAWPEIVSLPLPPVIFSQYLSALTLLSSATDASTRVSFLGHGRFNPSLSGMFEPLNSRCSKLQVDSWSCWTPPVIIWLTRLPKGSLKCPVRWPQSLQLKLTHYSAWMRNLSYKSLYCQISSVSTELYFSCLVRRLYSVH